MAQRRQPRQKMSEEEPDSIEEVEQVEEQELLDQFAALEGLLLDEHQLMLLAELDRLEKSLHGPQSLLEIAGGFSRPAFPLPSQPKSRNR